MEKIDYEAPELMELVSPLAVIGDSACADGIVESQDQPCPSGADD